MTHDELLSTIEHWNWVEPEPLLKAVRGIVELHKPKTYLKGRVVCDCCNIGGFRTVLYPCPTIQEIQSALEQPHLNHRMA